MNTELTVQFDNTLYPHAVEGRGWPEAFESFELKPEIHRLHISNSSANRIKSVFQHDIGEIGHLQPDNILTAEGPNPIPVGCVAKIGKISSTKESEN